MAFRMSERTHCVTFTHDGDKYYAVKSRTYGDEMAEGVSEPELRCAMPLKHANRLAEIAIKAKMANVKVSPIKLK